MADLEATRKTGEAKVMYLLPDVCKTPMGALMVPVPYPIVGPFAQSVGTVATVLFCKLEAFTMASRVQTVICDEQGVGGGIKSGVHKAECEPIKGSSTVNAKGDAVIRHDDLFWMNNKNTVGQAVLPGPGGGDVAPSGAIAADTNPEKKPETPKEEKAWYEKTYDYVSGVGEGFIEEGEKFVQGGIDGARNIYNDPSLPGKNLSRIYNETTTAVGDFASQTAERAGNIIRDPGLAARNAQDLINKANNLDYGKIAEGLGKKAMDFLSDPKAVGGALFNEAKDALATLGAGVVLKKGLQAGKVAGEIAETADTVKDLEKKLPDDVPDVHKPKGGPDASTPIDGTTVNDVPKKKRGRRGSEATRIDIDNERDRILKEHPDWEHTHGGTDTVTGAPKPEMYVPGAEGGTKGSTYPDLSFRKPDGTFHHHNTIDTYADGLTPTVREATNANRLQGLRPNDTVSLSPKPKPGK